MDDAVKQVGNSASDIESSADLIHTAVDTFDQIFQNIQETSHLIEDVVEKINQVDQVATNVAAISEEQAASPIATAINAQNTIFPKHLFICFKIYLLFLTEGKSIYYF